MATTETVPMEVSDAELFQGSIAEEPRQETPAPEPQPEPERSRDEQGRYVKAEPEKVAAETPIPDPAKPQPEPPKDDQAGNVPSWRLREEREAREAAQRRADESAQQLGGFRSQLDQALAELAQLKQPKTEPVDFFQNPEDAFKQRISPIETQMQGFMSHMTYRASLAENIATHGKATVDEMREAVKAAYAKGDPAVQILRQQMEQSGDPVGVSMEWYRTRKLVEVTGGDPAKYREKLSDELVKDPAFQKKVVEFLKGQVGQGSTASVIQLPPSLNRAPGSGVTQTELDDNDMSDAALFNDAVAKRRR